MKTELAGIRKTFGETDALNGVDLEIGEGEFVAIVGPSGCGKTTLLRLIAGFETPSAGEIKMGGRTVAGAGIAVPPEKRDLGMVFQSFALWPHMTVSEQVAFPLRHHRFIDPALKRESAGRVRQMLSMVGLAQYGSRMPSELSGGQKQRVAIARALAPNPSLLLMDEPLSSLDARLRLELRNEIQTIHRQTGTSIVYVTHDQDEALAMADRIVVMNGGKIEQAGTPEEIYSRPDTPFVATFIGKANLIPGDWRDGRFHPFGSPELAWTVHDVADSFHESGLCPLRPEQLAFGTGEGIRGTVRNVLYQGREIHYSIDVGKQTVDLVTGLGGRLRVGDPVVLQYRSTPAHSSSAKAEMEYW